MSEIYRLAISPHARMQNYRDFNSPYAYGTVPYAYYYYGFCSTNVLAIGICVRICMISITRWVLY